MSPESISDKLLNVSKNILKEKYADSTGCDLCEFCEDQSNVGTKMENGPAGAGMVHTACIKKQVKKKLISKILSWYPDRDPSDFDGLAATLHNDAWKQGVIISTDEARISIINAFRDCDSKEKYAKSQATSSLDRHIEQLRRIETKPLIDEQTLKNGFQKKHLFGDHLEKTKLYFAEEWPVILEDCDKWQDAMERCYISLQNHILDAKKGIIMQCQTRFSRNYKREMAWRMQQFSEKMQKGGFRFGLQITLSTDPKKFSNLDEVGKAWKLQLEHFMDFMNKRLRDAGKKEMSFYLRACELTDSGLMHTHIGIYGPGIAGKIKQQVYNRNTRSYDTITDYLFPQKDINELWTKYGMITGDHNIGTWVNRAPVSEVSDYITKHVAKSWGGESNDMLEAFLHYTNMRQWSASRGAIPALPESIESWVLRGVSFSPGEALLDRLDMIQEGLKIISDDTIEWERKQQVTL